MARNRYLTAFEALVAIAAGYAVGASALPTINYSLAVEFLVVVFVLDLLDLYMPYGETMPVDSAIVVACLVLAGPVTAGFVTVVARIAVHLARKGSKDVDKTISLLARRLLAVASCGYLSSALTPFGGTQAGALYLQGLVTGVAFVAIELLVAQIQAAPRLRERFWQLLVGNLALQGTFLGAQVSVAVLTVITYGAMKVWALLVMALLIVLLRQSLDLYLAIRQAYRATIEALVTAIEAQNPGRKGHAERVESLAHSIGLHLGVRGRELENLGYAALLHDVDTVGSDYEEADSDSLRRSGETVSSVRFLSEVTPILRLCDGIRSTELPSRGAQRAAAVVAVASDLDDAANPHAESVRTTSVDRVISAGVDRQLVALAQSAAHLVQAEGGGS